MDAKFFENLDQAKADAALDSDGTTMTDIRRVRGQERQQELIMEYRRFLKDSAAAVLLKGDMQTAFAHEAEEVGSTLTVDAYGAYHDLLKGLWEAQGGTGRFALDQMVALHARLETFARRNKVEIFRMPTFDETMNAFHKDKDSFIECLRAEIAKTLGGLVVVHGVQNQLFTAAIAAKATTAPVPVVVKNAIAGEIESLTRLFNGRVVEASGTDEVVEVFKQLLNKLKTKE